MKKISRLLSLSLVLLPGLTFASQKIFIPASGPACGNPPDVKPNFCHCFIKEAHKVCLEKMHMRGICKEKILAENFRDIRNIPRFCHKFEKLHLIPAGVSQTECISSIDYLQQNCDLM